MKKIITRIVFLSVSLAYLLHAYVLYEIGGFVATKQELALLIPTSCAVFIAGIVSRKFERLGGIFFIISSVPFGIFLITRLRNHDSVGNIVHFSTLMLIPILLGSVLIYKNRINSKNRHQ